MASEARGIYTTNHHGFNRYLLPGDVPPRWSLTQQRDFIRMINRLAASLHRGDLKSAFAEWARTASPDEIELARKVMWEMASLKV
ncbi:MAG: hypothetical protein ACUVTZ_01165 [Armatimonadota bacterium]